LLRLQIGATYTGKRPNSAVFSFYHMQIDANDCKPLVDILVDIKRAGRALLPALSLVENFAPGLLVSGCDLIRRCLLDEAGDDARF